MIHANMHVIGCITRADVQRAETKSLDVQQSWLKLMQMGHCVEQMKAAAEEAAGLYMNCYVGEEHVQYMLQLLYKTITGELAATTPA